MFEILKEISINEVYWVYYVYIKQNLRDSFYTFTLCTRLCNFYKFKDVGKMIITRKSFLKEVSL